MKLLMHGLFPLLSVLLAETGVWQRDSKPIKPDPPLVRLVLRNFISAADFRSFLIASGSLLAGAGALCTGWSLMIMGQEQRAAEEQADQDFARESGRALNCSAA